MTREEAIKYLVQPIVSSTDVGKEKQKELDAYNMAIKALKRTEPQGVFYEGDGYADGEMVYDFAECPRCGYEYEDGDKDWGFSFCPNCGQALKWEVEDDQR